MINMNEKTAEELLDLYFETADESNGEVSQSEMGKAIGYLKAAADKGLPEAWAELGACYYNGIGVIKDDKKAIEYMEKAALRDVANAQMNLYIMMFQNAQTDEEKRNAFYWLDKAVEQELASALYEMGTLYYNGLVYKQDFSKAADYYQQSSDAGSAEAMAMLGAMYQNGQGFEKDLEKAAECFTEAAESGSLSGLFNIGAAYMGGLGVEQDYEEAVNCFMYIIDLEEPFYLMPDLNDADTRSDIALTFHRMAVYDLVYPMAHHNLGVIFQQGLGAEIDKSKALYHFMLAAENNYAPSCMQAGAMLYVGEGHDADYAKAFEYLTAASGAGINEAKLIISMMYWDGDGVIKDREKSIALLDELIAMGNVEAMKAKNELLNSKL